MAESLGKLTIALSFIAFFAMSAISYWFLRKKTFFRWKLNLTVFLVGASATAGIIVGLNYIGSFQAMMIVGIVLLAPQLMYHVMAIRTFIDNSRNTRNIKTYDDK